LEKTKPFIITKQLVLDAYKLVKMNAGSAGVDQQSIADFEVKLKDNLYKLWNRMSSGSYFPPPVKAVPIPKKTGGERILGVPMVPSYYTSYNTILGFYPNFGYLCRMIN
jgi:RNA-directed DNA polymerase